VGWRLKRCAWATREPLLSYHDQEWGTPLHDERKLFEFLILEGAQAGLSWETILRKRAAYRKAFERFVPKTVAAYTGRDVARLMNDAGIVRNRGKIESAITNAKVYLEIQTEFKTFDAYLAGFTESVALSKDLKKRGMRFVGPTIVESFMEATGRLDHHEPDCFRRASGVRRGRAPVARSAARRRRE